MYAVVVAEGEWQRENVASRRVRARVRSWSKAESESVGARCGGAVSDVLDVCARRPSTYYDRPAPSVSPTLESAPLCVFHETARVPQNRRPFSALVLRVAAAPRSPPTSSPTTRAKLRMSTPFPSSPRPSSRTHPHSPPRPHP